MSVSDAPQTITSAGRAGLATFQESIDFLKIGATLGRRLLREGSFPAPPVRLGRAIRFRWSDLESYVTSAPVPATADKVKDS